ncbi:MAG TPA: ABC transporter permease subunit [Flavobacterium sp.]|jgi:ABC-2 type transport system permease protein|nr:ABC transporter permease subunit [Flavobacterium sp.]
MRQILKFELIKLVHQPRTFLSIGLMMVMVGLIFWGLQSEGENALAYLFQSLGDTFLMQGNILNGYMVSFLILNTLWIHIPVLIVIVTGDLFSSELETGTIRLLMTRPISRNRVAISKFFTAVLYVFFFLLIFTVISLGLALVLFGEGDLIVAFNGLQIIPEADLLWRFFAAFGYAFLAMSTFAILSVTVSFFTRKSLVAILITIGVIVISTLLQTLAASLFIGWESFLITYHFSQWQLFFYSEIDVISILNSAIWLIGFSGICILVSLLRFNKLKITE